MLPGGATEIRRAQSQAAPLHDGQAAMVNRFYIEWSNGNGGAISAVQNIGRELSKRQRRDNQHRRFSHSVGIVVAADVTSMLTELA